MSAASTMSDVMAPWTSASQVMGVQHQLTQGISNSYGYTGVIFATMGGLSALGVVLVAGDAPVVSQALDSIGGV